MLGKAPLLRPRESVCQHAAGRRNVGEFGGGVREGQQGRLTAISTRRSPASGAEHGSPGNPIEAEASVLMTCLAHRPGGAQP